MKAVGKLLLTLLALLLLILVAAYFALQSHWGARQISTWVNGHTGYRLTLEALHYDIRQPATLRLDGFSLARAGQPPVIRQATVTLTLGRQQFTTPRHFSAILLRHGGLTLAAQGIPDLPVSADSLRLDDMQILWPRSDWPLQASGVNGGILPLQSKTARADFQFSANRLTVGHIPAHNILIQGEYRDGQLWLNNLGADVAHGQITARTQRSSEGVWRIGALRMSQIHWQSPQTLPDLLRILQGLPPLEIEQLDLLGANLQGNGWALGGLDVTLRNLTLTDGHWYSQQGELAFNATDIVVDALHLREPLFSAFLTPQGIDIRQFSTRWNNALIRTGGHWQRDSRQLSLSDLSVTGLEYTLPASWRARWQQPLPGWLAGVTLDRFSLSRTLLIDINPRFPFQITALDGFGTHVTLARNHHWGLWQGQMQFNASAATFNRVDLRRPSLTLQADDQGVHIRDLSALSQEGLLEANATLTRSDNLLTLALHGRGVPPSQLEAWGWPALAPLQGNISLQLALHAPLQYGVPFHQGVDATLQAQDDNGRTLYQKMVNGKLLGGE